MTTLLPPPPEADLRVAEPLALHPPQVVDEADHRRRHGLPVQGCLVCPQLALCRGCGKSRGQCLDWLGHGAAQTFTIPVRIDGDGLYLPGDSIDGRWAR